MYMSTLLPSTNFNPRPPRGGRLFQFDRPLEIGTISIHALREEGDTIRPSRTLSTTDFNPRPPRGGRLVRWEVALPQFIFQSTPSARRATTDVAGTDKKTTISIHALREEGDHGLHPRRLWSVGFQSTPSARRATIKVANHRIDDLISIHALREEGDQKPPAD